MEYDPVKFKLAGFIGKSAFLRRCFFMALDLLFLRAWYVRRELRRIAHKSGSDSTVTAGRKSGRMRILDAGMGFGQYSDRMLRIFPGADLVGLEIDRTHFYSSENYFRENHPTSRLLIGDIQSLPLLKDEFDLVLSVDVMEHVAEDEATFSEFHRILRPGGIFIMHTPRIQDDEPDEHLAPESPSEQPDTIGWNVDEHVRDGYKDSQAIEKLRRAGFRIVRIVRGYGRPGRIAWTLLQRIPMSMLGRGKFMIPLAALYLVIVIIPALKAMWLDLLMKDHPTGGSLLLVAECVDNDGQVS